MKTNRKIILASGGSGGGIFPAVALATYLKSQKRKYQILCDTRGAEFLKKANVKADYRTMELARPRAGLINKALYWFCLGMAFLECIITFIKDRPQVVIGFGGYPTIPPMMAAILLRIPTIIYQPDTLLGKANRLLAWYSKRICTAYETTKFLKRIHKRKTRVVGPIIRETFDDIKVKAPKKNFKKLTLMVIGGSQGAIPRALSFLPAEFQKRIFVKQQVVKDVIAATKEVYSSTECKFELKEFFADMATELAEADVVLSRAGASAIAELIALNKPSILIPLPTVSDNHQYHNAAFLSKANAAFLMEEKNFSPIKFCDILKKFLEDPSILERMANNCKKLHSKDAKQKFLAVIDEVAKE
jgi:UDP-N-acetylglucosamine--N-acetylmuramyl-(pentapeptide) pyrophosphoryl-undecaprenol N-acetylglucosamine transferase